jgi:outer membrane receptor protein involved in Fe transport
MRLILVLAAVLSAQALYAQKITIRGRLLDSSDAPLPQATIMLLSPKDSSLVNFGSSNKEGFFELKNLSRANYIFKVTYVGHAPLMIAVSPKPDELIVELGAQKMEQESTMLGAVEIKGERAPVTIKKDTIEFNAGSFKTQPNAMAEDLIKKLPGMEVDNDGTIRAQGEQVQRVTVDGKEFFGRDPKLATRNLPADAVDKVQVFDKKSDQATFTGIDDGQREKTINLELKEEKRKGMFGNAMGGYGTEDRFTGRLSLNRFSKGQQFSVVGTANNINEQGFSIDDYMTFTGGAQAFAGGGGGQRTITISGGGGGGAGMQLGGGQTNGLMSTYGGGINFNKDFSTKTKLSANYFVNYLDHDITQNTERENFNTDNFKYYNELSKQTSTNLNHRLNLILDHEIDSANSIKWTNGITYSDTKMLQQSLSETLSSELVEQNATNRTTNSVGTSLSYNSELLYRHRFGKKGRTFSSTLTFGLTDSDRDGIVDGDNSVLNQEPVLLDQTYTQTTDNLTYGANLSYTEPLGGRKYLEANYSIRQNKNDVNRKAYNTVNDDHELMDSLSNVYNSEYLYQRGGVNFRMNKESYSLTVGAGYQQTLLDGEIIRPLDQAAIIDRTFSNFLPSVHFNYDFDNNIRFRADYETNMQAPTIQQLQPTRDVNNFPNIYEGNPNLKPSYQHSLRLNFSKFNPVSFVSFFTFVNATYTTDAITNSQSYNSTDSTRVTITKPINVDNNLNVMANANMSFPITKLFSRLNVGVNARGQQSINVSRELQDDVLMTQTEATINQLTLGGNIRYTFTYKEIFDLSLAANLSHQKTQYESTNTQDQEYFNRTYTTEGNFSFLKYYRLSGTFNYMQYETQADNSTISIPMLNLSFSRYFLKANAGEFKFTASNLLDKNLGVTQTANVNYFERQTMNSLGRYYMVSFTYAINRHLNPMGGNRGGGRRMMIMN